MTDSEMNKFLAEQADFCWHDFPLDGEPPEEDFHQVKCKRCGVQHLEADFAPNYLSPSNLSELIALIESKGYIWRLDGGITSNDLKSYRARLRKHFAADNISIKAIEQTDDTPSHALAEAFYNAEQEATDEQG